MFVLFLLLVIGNAQATFGDGSAGNWDFSEDYTLGSDTHFRNLIIREDATVYPDGYVLYVQDTLTVYGSINRDGNDGLGEDSTSDEFGYWYWCLGGGAALPTRSLGGSGAGGIGGDGGWMFATGYDSNPGTVGENVEGIASSSGGEGESSSGSYPSSGAAGGITTTFHTVNCQEIEYIIADASNRSGGPGGGGGGGSASGAGGGGGSGAGVMYISAKNIILKEGSTISAQGGNGYPCSYATGGGGGGGSIIIEYKTITNEGGLVNVSGGAGYVNGTSGTIYYCKISTPTTTPSTPPVISVPYPTSTPTSTQTLPPDDKKDDEEDDDIIDIIDDLIEIITELLPEPLKEPFKETIKVIKETITYISTPFNWLILLFTYVGAFISKMLFNEDDDYIEIISTVLLFGTISWIIVLFINFFILIISENEIYSICIFLLSGFIITTLANLSSEEPQKKKPRRKY